MVLWFSFRAPRPCHHTPTPSSRGSTFVHRHAARSHLSPQPPHTRGGDRCVCNRMCCPARARHGARATRGPQDSVEIPIAGAQHDGTAACASSQAAWHPEWQAPMLSAAGAALSRSQSWPSQHRTGKHHARKCHGLSNHWGILRLRSPRLASLDSTGSRHPCRTRCHCTSPGRARARMPRLSSCKARTNAGRTQ